MSKYNLNNRAQAGEATTWIIATLIILFIMLIFIWASSILGQNNNLKSLVPGSKSYLLDNKLLNTQTAIAYLKNPALQPAVDSWALKDGILFKGHIK